MPVTQLNTDGGFGGECHLDANMVRTALPEIPLDEIDLLVIENVGNLVCPAEFRVGEDAKAMVCSVTEGEDKPLKYPLMFRTCELVVVNKIDLLPHLDYDLDRCWPTWRRCNPGVETMPVSARTGEGVEGFRDWLAGGARGRPRRLDAGRRHGRRLDAAGGGRAPAPTRRFFDADAERLARSATGWPSASRAAGACSRSGGSPQARSDARHVAVEFVHPVIVGKRALPALALTAEGGPLAEQVDAGRGAGRHGHGVRGARPPQPWRIARDRGCLTVAFAAVAPGAGADGSSIPPSEDPFVAQELAETAYHLLWELVHVFFEHRGLLQGREARRCTTPGRRASCTRSWPSRRPTWTRSWPTCATRC